MATDVTAAPYEELVDRVLRWAAGQDPHRQGAVQLLIAHDCWLRRNSFCQRAVHLDGDGRAWIDFAAGRDAFNEGVFDAALPTEIAVLNLALALGTDWYNLDRMDARTSAMVAHAFETACGLALQP